MMSSFPPLSLGILNIPLRNTVIISGYYTAQVSVFPYTDFVPFQNTDFNANQIVLALNSWNPTNCNVSCAQSIGCIGFVTTHDNCILKTQISSLVVDVTKTSSFMVQPQRNYTIFNGIDFPSNDFITYFVGGRNLCQQACDALQICVGYVMNEFPNIEI